MPPLMPASMPCTAAAAPCTVVMHGMFAPTAAVQGIEASINGGIGVRSLQQLHSVLRG